jgi:hypothetical protein
VNGKRVKNVGEGVKGRGPLAPPPHPLPQSLDRGKNRLEKWGLKAPPSPATFSGLGGGCGGRAGISGPWPSPHHPLSQISLTPGRAALVFGGPLRPLAAAAAAWGVARGARVLMVDAANAFDPYRLVREARGRGVSRAAALGRVRVARAFTSHQLVPLLQEELPGELVAPSLVLILGPVSLFYDEQIPLAERQRLFGNMIDILMSYKTRAPLLLLQPPLPRGAVNRGFGRLMTPLLDSLVKMDHHQENRTGTPGGEVSTGVSPSRSHLRGERCPFEPGRPQTGGLSHGRIDI